MTLKTRLLPFMTALMFATSAFAMGSTEQAEEEEKAKPDPQSIPRHLIVGLDLSRSNPLVAHDGYAQKISERIAPMVSDLPVRSVVTIRTFGEYNSTANNLRIDRVISANAKPEDVERLVAGVIAGIPKLIKDGKLKVQNRTNILPFLENMAQISNCRDMKATVVLATDGVEDSEYAQLVKASSSLPAPEKKIFYRCAELQILGLGQGLNSPSMTKRLRTEWQAWSKAAGFKKFEGLYDW
jgi:hypothetical protein